MTAALTTPEFSETVHDKIDRFEFAMSKLPQLSHDLVHRFTPGLYMRQLTMPAGTVWTSKIHNTEHPFVVLRGRAEVMREDGTWETISAPYLGITKPGTRRVLAIIDESVWVTFHPTNETDLEKIEGALIRPHNFMDSIAERSGSCLK